MSLRDEVFNFSTMDDEPLRRVFLLVASVRDVVLGSHVYAHKTPRWYERGQLYTDAPVTPCRQDLQSGAALGCVNRRTAAMWRRVLARELLAMTQSTKRGEAIACVLESLNTLIIYDWNRSRVDYVDGRSLTLVLTSDRRLNLDATLAKVDALLGPTLIVERPAGYTNAECLLAWLVDNQHGRIFFHVVIDALRGEFGDRAESVYRATMPAGSVLSWSPTNPTTSISAFALRIHNDALNCPLPQEATAVGQASVIGSLPFSVFAYSFLADGERRAARYSVLFQKLRSLVSAGAVPALPPRLFERQMLRCSVPELVRVDDASTYLLRVVDGVLAQRGSMELWQWLRWLYQATYPRRTEHGNYAEHRWNPHVLPFEDRHTRTAECSDNLFRDVGSSRFYHRADVKLSNWGAASAADVLFHFAVLPENADLYQRQPTDGERIMRLLEATKALIDYERWIVPAINHQRYLATVHHEDRINAIRTNGTRATWPVLILRDRHEQFVTLESPHGRALDRIWQNIYGAPSTHGAEFCERVCNSSSDGGPRPCAHTVALISADRTGRQLPTLEVRSERVRSRPVSPDGSARAHSAPPSLSNSSTRLFMLCNAGVCSDTPLVKRPVRSAELERLALTDVHVAALQFGYADIARYIADRFAILSRMELLAMTHIASRIVAATGNRAPKAEIRAPVMSFERATDGDGRPGYFIRWLPHTAVESPSVHSNGCDRERYFSSISEASRMLDDHQLPRWAPPGLTLSDRGAESALQHRAVLLGGRMADTLPMFHSVQQSVFELLGSLGADEDRFQNAFELRVRCRLCRPGSVTCDCEALTSTLKGTKRALVADEDVAAPAVRTSDELSPATKRRKSNEQL